MGWQLAQLNVSRWIVDPEGMAARSFRARVDAVYARAEAADGFVWRLPPDPDVDAVAAAVFGTGWLVNLSVWRDVDALRAFTFDGGHAEVLRRRRRWFAPPDGPNAVLWWVPAGRRPDLHEAAARLDDLRRGGPSATAFTFAAPHPPPRTLVGGAS